MADLALASYLWPVQETSVPSAPVIDLAAVLTRAVLITGTTTITGFGAGRTCEYLIRFAASLTLTHTAGRLVLPGGVNIVTAAGDAALVTSDAAGVWTVRHYQRASGKPIVGPAAADITDASTSGRSVLTGTAAQGATALGLGTNNDVTLGSLFLQSGLLIGGNVGVGTPSPQYKLEINGTFGVSGLTTFNNIVRLGVYTVATLPSGQNGAMAYASNARKISEAAGAGTGVVTYYSNGAWRRLSDDSPVAA